GRGEAPAPIAGLTLTAEEVTPAGALQPRLWGPGAGEDLRARRAVERVQALLGGDAVLTVRLQGGRDPRDRVQLVPYGEQVPPERAPDRPWPGALPPPAPSVVLPEPLPAQVLDAAGRPVVVDVRLAVSGAPARVVVPDVAGGLDAAVTDWAGPWPVAERWWTPRGRRRVFFQVTTEVMPEQAAPAPGLLLSASAGAWVLEALYDWADGRADDRPTRLRRAARPLRVQLPRRRLAPRGARRRGRPPGAGDDRPHRPRRPVRRGALLRGGQAPAGGRVGAAHGVRRRAAPARRGTGRARAGPAHRRARPACHAPARAGPQRAGVPEPVERHRDGAPRGRGQGRRPVHGRRARRGGGGRVARAHRVPQGRRAPRPDLR